MAITVDAFMNHWLSPAGQVIDYDRQYNYQCVDLIRQYFYECRDFGGGGGVPSAISYWTSTPGSVLSHFNKIATNDPVRGDVVILKTKGHTDFAGEGHIGIATGSNDAANAEIMEQNGSTGNGDGTGGNAIRTRRIPKDRIAGVLRPIAVAAAPAAPPAPPLPKYVVVESYVNGKQIQLNKQPTNLWGMNYDFNYMKDHPVEVHNQGEVWTVYEKVHHQNGYDYYRREGQVDGFNVLDCDPYTPPPPPPPAAPVVARPAQKVTFVAAIKVYNTEEDARARTNPTGQWPIGEYFLYNDKKVVQEVALTNSSTDTKWFYVNDNVAAPAPAPEPPKPEPKPEPAPVPKVPTYRPSQVPVGLDSDPTFRATYRSFNPDGSADAYKLVQPVNLKEYTGKRTDPRSKGMPFAAERIVYPTGRFWKNGVEMYRIRSKQDTHYEWFYGISKYGDNNQVNLVKLTDREQAVMTLGDIWHDLRGDLKYIWDILVLRKVIKKKE